MNFHFEQQCITNDGTTHFLTGRQNDLHSADRRWTGVGDGTGSRQHGYVEANSDRLFGGVIHASNLVGLGLESHQLRMFLDDEDELAFAVLYLQSTSIKTNL